MAVSKMTEKQRNLIAKALADPRRAEILHQIGKANDTLACSNLRCLTDAISAATLSHHMKELETAGLVRSEKDGKFVNYFPQTHILRAYLDRLKSDLA